MIKKTIIIVFIILFIYPIISPASAEECTSCHKIRHGLTGNLCENCHYNTTFSNGKHLQKPFSPGFVHDSFDWEGDNANEKGPGRLNESCPVCHVSMLEHTSPTLNVCEDCHVKEIKRGKLITVRKDIDNFTPRVYSHYNGSAVDVPDQSSAGKTRSTCFGYDTKTGEGSCHGVNFRIKDSAGGFFAFNAHNYTGRVLNRGDPYHWNAPADAMPDSKDCAFCHTQEDIRIRKAWGNPGPLPADASHNNKKSRDCTGCHVNGEVMSFHGKEVALKVDRMPWTNFIAVPLLILAVIVIYIMKKRRIKSIPI